MREIEEILNSLHHYSIDCRDGNEHSIKIYKEQLKFCVKKIQALIKEFRSQTLQEIKERVEKKVFYNPDAYITQRDILQIINDMEKGEKDG